MRENTLIVTGRTSFLARHFIEVAKNQFSVTAASRLENLSLSPQKANVFVNFSYTPEYVNAPYDPQYDVDLKIAKRLQNMTAHFIMLSTRMVYGSGDGRILTETAAPAPTSNYARNKLETERRIQDILGDRCSIIRLSNIFGMEYGRRTFAGHALTSLKNNGIISLDIQRDVFRDFLPIQCFAKILCNFISTPTGGIYNLGSGQKMTVGEIADAFVEGYESGGVEVTQNRNYDSFCLDVSKIRKVVNVNVTQHEIKQYAQQAGRELKDA